ncbi:cytochrome b5 reductase 4 isoform X1 [Sinocyclocheilus anshuiensis]|uniref:Cytochrome b5 reductase 4 n=1 Tax=Sinocyclocheilus anshuiensis TaxID=1608454 RepID=A0A671Q541_9TELE|nr:PREDICTED: cytochrome b5 reductase 4 isoform X1 [Sinocyclocheilus anshuiensis]
MLKEDDEDFEEEDEEENRAANRGKISAVLSVISSVVSGFLRNWICLKASEMLNVPSQSFPAAGSQQRVAPTGQSRNKVALKPGHSLLDWIRLTKSGRDLTGLRGQLIEVTEEELKKHSTRNDCWTCIRGMVYNVSAYMDFHPGGEEELMRAAGIDSTDLFDQVHRWVNYESMLKECLVGRMAVKPNPALQAQTEKTESTHMNGLPVSSRLRQEPLPTPLPAKDHRPRYDWFQTDGTVNIVIHTKRKIPSAGCAVVDLQDDILQVEMLLGKMSYLLYWRLSSEVQGRVDVQTAHSVGKVQVCLHKSVKDKWTKVGQPLEHHDTFIQCKDRELFYRECVLVSKTDITHDTQVLRLQLPSGSHMQVPVGRHVYLKTSLQGTDVVKPYTPVDQKLIPPSQCSAEMGSDLHLMIKICPDGLLTSHLANLPIGSSLSVGGPEGSFTMRVLRDVTHLYMLAAGTGFTPMARLIRLALQDLTSIRKTKLMFFNRQERDILWCSQLDELCSKEERFEVEYVLSEPTDSWKGRRGQIDACMLQNFLERPEDSKCLVCVCGPTGFTELAVQLVRQLDFSEEEIHIFQG